MIEVRSACQQNSHAVFTGVVRGGTGDVP